MLVGGCPFSAGAPGVRLLCMNRLSSCSCVPHFSIILNIIPPLLPAVGGQPGRVSRGLGLHRMANLPLGNMPVSLESDVAGMYPRTPLLSWRLARCSGKSVHPLPTLLARAMEISTFVTHPSVHTHRSCFYLEGLFLGRRWRKWK